MTKPTIGLPRGTVVLESHQPHWRQAFEAEAHMLQPLIGGRPIEHVGSTAVPGLVAKPIIDIAIAVDTLAEAESFVEALAALGYTYKGEAGVSGRRFFVKGPAEKRTVYLHLGLPDGEYASLVSFRDTLRARPDIAAEYSQLKQSLARQFADDRRAYTSGKAEFIQKVLVLHP